MGRRTLGLIVIMILLASTVAGCGAAEKAQQATDAVSQIEQAVKDEATAVVAQTPVDEQEEEATEVPTEEMTEDESETEEDASDVASLDTLDSYRQTMSTRIAQDEEVTEYTIVTEFVRDPAAYRTYWTSTSSDNATPQIWEVIAIGDTTYMRSGDEDSSEWVAYSSADADESSSSADITNWMNAGNYMDDDDCQKKGHEDVDGQDTVLYVCDQGLFTAYSGIWGVTGKLLEASLKTWVSVEYGVPLRSISEWVGEDEDGVRHEYYSEGEITDINKPITIEAPDVEAPGLPEDVPAYPDAKVTLAMAGMVSMDTDATVDEVTAFYKEAMPEQGWTLDSEMEGMLSYTKDARTAMISISEDDGTVSVTVFVQ